MSGCTYYRRELATHWSRTVHTAAAAAAAAVVVVADADAAAAAAAAAVAVDSHKVGSTAPTDYNQPE